MAKTSKKSPTAKKTPPKPASLGSLKKEGIGLGDVWPVIILILTTWVCFSNAFKNDFTNWDDVGYVLNNPLINSLSIDHLKNIFKTDVMSNYHPLAILSLAIDYHFFQLDPYGYHATSIVIHIMNVLMVFLFIRLLTGKMIIAFITALLFGIHPMHVESVSWVAERKDVLYVFFYLSSLCIYTVYIKSKKKKKHVLFFSGILFFLSLFSKGQAVTLPVVLLLIDYFSGRTFTRNVLLEKVPFFLASIVMGIVAVMAQKESGAIEIIQSHTFFERVLFASYSFLNYVLKMFYPGNLSAYYPYPEKTGDSYPFIYYAAPVLFLVLIFLFVKYFRKNKNLLFGFGFYAVNIILLVQLLPVGSAIISERYSYLSYTGLCFIVGNSFYSVWNSGKRSLSVYKYLFSVVLIAFVTYLGFKTFGRNKIWKNSEQLWTDVIRQYPNTVIAYSNRGTYYQKQGDYDLAVSDLNKALALRPDHVEALVNRSNIYRIKGNYDLAIADCNKAIETKKNYPGAYMNRGIAYCFVERFDDALVDFEKVISVDPANADVYCNRGNIYDMRGRFDSAIADYSKSIEINPLYSDAFYSRGKTYVKKKNYEAAVNDLNKALSLKANKPDFYYYRSMAYKGVNDIENAINDALTSKQMGMPFDDAYMNELYRLKKK